MRLAIAPSGFKECLAAEEVAEAIACGVRRVLPQAELDSVPLADGGEGTTRTLVRCIGGTLVPATVRGPFGAPVRAEVGLLADGSAVLEMAGAAGLRHVPRNRRDPGLGCTYGVGELIRTALDTGTRRIVVGCGDSGTCDGGAGALRALGVRLLDGHGVELPPGGYALADLVTIDTSGLDTRVFNVDIVVACNQYNVLTGCHGVARMFGPQKGADVDQVERLSSAMDTFAEVLAGRGTDVWLMPGSGASGGMGAGLAAVLGARLAPRFEVLLDDVDLNRRLAAADLVFTAEGALDRQSIRGKVPGEVARRAKRYGKPVLALAGTLGEGAASAYEAGIDAFTGIARGPIELAEAIRLAPDLIADASERMLRAVLLGRTMGTHSPSHECSLVS